MLFEEYWVASSQLSKSTSTKWNVSEQLLIEDEIWSLVTHHALVSSRSFTWRIYFSLENHVMLDTTVEIFTIAVSGVASMRRRSAVWCSAWFGARLSLKQKTIIIYLLLVSRFWYTFSSSSHLLHYYRLRCTTLYTYQLGVFYRFADTSSYQFFNTRFPTPMAAANAFGMQTRMPYSMAQLRFSGFHMPSQSSKWETIYREDTDEMMSTC